MPKKRSKKSLIKKVLRKPSEVEIVTFVVIPSILVGSVISTLILSFKLLVGFPMIYRMLVSLAASLGAFVFSILISVRIARRTALRAYARSRLKKFKEKGED